MQPFMKDCLEAGVDEAGRGPLFGRVYTAAVILDQTFDHSRVKDSKKFTSKKKIKEASDYIKEHAVSWSITYADEKVIDEINILKATMKSMHESILGLHKKPEHLLIDGNYFKPIVQVIDEKLVHMPYTCVEKGDNTYTSIAAASILAKVARDEYILDLCEKHPELKQYGIDKNKGYGAKIHMEAIKKYGITEWHRKSYKPCKNAMEK
jgi:ribonuclease HII